MTKVKMTVVSSNLVARGFVRGGLEVSRCDKEGKVGERHFFRSLEMNYDREKCELTVTVT